MLTHPMLLSAAAGVLLLGAPSPNSTGPAGKVAGEGPPGLILVEGGRVKIGTKVKDIEPLVLANEDMANRLVGETPQHTVNVDDFFLMVSEVTNEQFAAFVVATDGRPPYSWGGPAIEEARLAWFEEQNRKRQEAKEAGERFIATGEKFEPEAWWEKNWEGAEWDIPDELLDHPVTYVSYEEALAYSRWAGLRLMTEFEYQCAGRGTSDDVYPWGKEFDAAKVAGLDAGRDKTWAVGSFPDGSRNGIHDLVGNVWEWTSSPYRAYPGYKAIEFKLKRDRKKEKFTPYAPFDANVRVIAGGSIHMDPLALRLNVRMSAARMQRTNGLGFRCAASQQPGRDLAEYVANEAIPGNVLPVDTEYLPNLPTILHRWTFEQPNAGEQGSVETAQPTAGERPADYAVITGYEAMLFVPVSEINAASRKDLEPLTQHGPIPIGLLYVTQPIKEPALGVGAYMLSYRAEGELQKLAEGAEEPIWRTMDGFDPTRATYFAFDAEGLPVTAWPASTIEYGKADPSTARYEPWVPPAKVDEDAPPPVPIDTLRFYINVPGRQRGRAFKLDLPLRIEPGTIDDSWHSK